MLTCRLTAGEGSGRFMTPVVWAQPHIFPYIQVHTEAERIPVIYNQNKRKQPPPRQSLRPSKQEASDQHVTTHPLKQA
jgi:hypothetical protein